MHHRILAGELKDVNVHWSNLPCHALLSYNVIVICIFIVEMNECASMDHQCPSQNNGDIFWDTCHCHTWQHITMVPKLNYAHVIILCISACIVMHYELIELYFRTNGTKEDAKFKEQISMYGPSDLWERGATFWHYFCRHGCNCHSTWWELN